MNQVILSGRLVKDAELKRTASNLAIVSFTLAISEYNTTTKQKEVQFIDCVLFGKRGESLEKYVHKGEYIIVIGKIERKTYKTNDNKNHSVYRVKVEDFEFVPKGSGNSKEENPTNAILSLEDARPQEEVPLQPIEDLTDEDLPF